MSAQKHIAILITALGAGGAERVIAMLAHHWVDRGHRVSIITFDRADDPVYHPLPAQVTLWRLGAQVSVGYRGNARRLLRLRETLGQIRPDVLVSFLTKNNLLAALACLGTPTPLICSERNNPERQDANRLWNLLLKVGYRRADFIVCQTNAIRRCFPRSVRDRLVVIYNPIAGFDRDPDADDARTLCAVGRLTPQKGFPHLIDAFAKVADRHPEWNLTIWGNGEIRAALEQQVEQMGLGGRISLPGTTEQPGDWARHATIFVQSSLYEGFGNALGEALASGLPVVATDCDFGPAEMIASGENGVLVPVQDADAMADAIAGLITDHALRSSYGAMAKVSMRKFEPAAILSRWDDLIEATTRSRRKAAPWPQPEPVIENTAS